MLHILHSKKMSIFDATMQLDLVENNPACFFVDDKCNKPIVSSNIQYSVLNNTIQSFWTEPWSYSWRWARPSARPRRCRWRRCTRRFPLSVWWWRESPEPLCLSSDCHLIKTNENNMVWQIVIKADTLRRAAQHDSLKHILSKHLRVCR